ncbi:gastric inhibitory polypeptide [Catharus ustulatus]|uniref:gastric inhibitory polypeptide n=1 Tax=Catharus ustulatus TaxID=91951 RepID=UPI001C5BB2BF|nr:gastric inhibitory polypeptide [Catharus ustulatus]
MSLRSLRALPLLLAWLGVVSMEESGPGVPVAVPRPLHRRYSEATLASDYSRTMDHVLRKNFVEWLLARREKKSQDISEPFKREAQPQNSALEGSEGLREFLEQEFLTWLISGELCRAT